MLLPIIHVPYVPTYCSYGTYNLCDRSEEDMEMEQPHDQKGRIEADSIEDILAQFEAEPATKTVSCPNCRSFFYLFLLNSDLVGLASLCSKAIVPFSPLF
jgi:hypothetical protein